MTIKVKLRQKAISGKRKSLYLDFYPPIPHSQTGALTRRQFLGLYIQAKANTPIDKQSNKEVLQLAEQIRSKREIELSKPEIYMEYEREQLKIKEKGERSFIDYFRMLADKRQSSNHDNWVSAYKYLHAFTGGTLKFADLDEKFCNEFKDHLRTTKSNKSDKAALSQNSVVSYFNKFKAALKQAYKDGYLSFDLNSRIEPVKQAEVKRSFLTIEELNVLVKTDCPNPLLKRAALFSALTGLRFSDIEKLLWSEIEFIAGNGYFIQFKQQKTKGVEVMPISEQAYSLLGDRLDSESRVFEGLNYSAYSNKHLAKWIGLAGITKDITFHCFRHTYATLQLSGGTDIYTVSKMLGHRELKTTQIYAKIIDKTKRDATNKIRLDL
jgi:integrase